MDDDSKKPFIRVKKGNTNYINKIYVVSSNSELEKILEGPATNEGLMPDEETLRQIEIMANLHTTDQEMARIFGCTDYAFREFKKKYAIVEKTIERGREAGKLSLRHKQFQMALEQDSVSMAIWLGKQYLGQSDKTQTENNVNLQVLKSIMDLEEESPQLSNNTNGNDNEQ